MGKPAVDDFKGTDRFVIVRRIGAGGMGVVYEALDKERNERVALKTLPQIDPRALYLFKQEFRSLTDVAHPNLAALHELISVGEQWFFTMEFVDGINFLEYVRKGIPGMTSPSTPADRAETVAISPGTVGRVSPRPGEPGSDAGTSLCEGKPGPPPVADQTPASDLRETAAYGPPAPAEAISSDMQTVAYARKAKRPGSVKQPPGAAEASTPLSPPQIERLRSAL